MNGTFAPIKGIPESLLSLFPLFENIARHLQPETQKRTLTRTEPCRYLDLRFLASGAVRNEFLLFTRHPIYSTLS